MSRRAEIPKKTFDQKFGVDFIKNIPLCPGVYQMLDETGVVIYVGKAKRLRRRLQQYRNARRCKKHHKMRTILSHAHSIRFNLCDSEHAALLLENQLIQNIRPKFNIAGAFAFLYPSIGIRRDGLNFILVYTTTPSTFESFEHFGAFRSRDATRNAFYALLDILSYLGHRETTKKLSTYPRVKFSHLAAYRQINEHWEHQLAAFLKGESTGFLENAFLALLEKPMARKKSAEIQEFFNALKRFFKFEARPLRKALLANGLRSHSIPQQERDQIFLTLRYVTDSS